MQRDCTNTGYVDLSYVVDLFPNCVAAAAGTTAAVAARVVDVVLWVQGTEAHKQGCNKWPKTGDQLVQIRKPIVTKGHQC